MDPLIAFALGAALSGAVILLLARLAKKKEVEFEPGGGGPEPIIIIGDGSIDFDMNVPIPQPTSSGTAVDYPGSVTVKSMEVAFQNGSLSVNADKAELKFTEAGSGRLIEMSVIYDQGAGKVVVNSPTIRFNSADWDKPGNSRRWQLRRGIKSVEISLSKGGAPVASASGTRIKLRVLP